MGDLTTRDEQMIVLGEQAEAYINHEYQQQAQRGGRSLSHDHYDVNSSRREWEQGVA
mgnify:CR=1 FL=1